MRDALFVLGLFGITLMVGAAWDWALRVRRMEYRMAELLLRVGNAARCPACGHPVIVGAFHDGDSYVCLDCGEHFTWTLDDGRYVLTRVEAEK